MDSDTKMARALAFMAIIAAAVVCYISHTAHHLEMHRIGFEKRNGQWVKQQIKEPKQ